LFIFTFVLEAPVHVVLAAWLMALAFKVLAFVPEVGLLHTSFCNNSVISPCLLSHWVGLGKIPETSDGEPGGVASDERRGVDPAARAAGGCLLGDVRPEPFQILIQQKRSEVLSQSSTQSRLSRFLLSFNFILVASILLIFF
jgi:hypothetical protein